MLRTMRRNAVHIRTLIRTKPYAYYSCSYHNCCYNHKENYNNHIVRNDRTHMGNLMRMQYLSTTIPSPVPIDRINNINGINSKDNKYRNRSKIGANQTINDGSMTLIPLESSTPIQTLPSIFEQYYHARQTPLLLPYLSPWAKQLQSLDKEENVWSLPQVSQVLNCLRTLRRHPKELNKFLPSLANVISRATSKHMLIDICGIFKVLNHFDSSVMAINPIISSLAKQLRQCNHRLSVESLGRLMSSLYQFDASSNEVKELIDAIACKLESQDVMKLTPLSVSHALQCTESMNKSNPQVRKLMDIFAKYIRNCEQAFTVEDIRNSLSTCSNAYWPVQEILDLCQAIDHQLRTNSIALTEDDIMWCFRYLNHLSTDVNEINSLVGILTECLENLTLKENSLVPFEVIATLRHKGTESIEIRKLLGVLLSKINNTSSIVSPLTISSACFGLRNKNFNVTGARELALIMMKSVYELDPKISASTSCKLISEIGLHRFVEKIQVEFVSMIQHRIKQCPDNLKPPDLALLLNSFMYLDSENEEVAKVLEIIADKIYSCLEPFSAEIIESCTNGIKHLTPNDAFTRILSALAYQVKHSSHDYTMHNVKNSLFNLGSIDCETAAVAQVIESLLLKIVCTQSNAFNLASNDVAAICYNLRNVRGSHVEGKRIIEMLVPVLSGLSNSSIESSTLSKVQCGMTAFGLRHFYADYPPIRAFVGELAKHVAACPEHFDDLSIGSCIYGHRRMDSIFPEIRAMIAALADKTTSSQSKLNQIGVGITLYGLYNKSSDSPEVRSLLSALTSKIADVAPAMELDSLALSTAVTGLSRMSDSTSEVRALLPHLTNIVRHSEYAILNQREVAFALYGLRNLSSTSRIVSDLVSALVPRVKASTEMLSARSIGRSLFGLQNMSSAHPPVRQMLEALHPKITGCEEALLGKDIALALHGLQHCSEKRPEVHAIIIALTDKIKMSPNPMSAREVGCALYGFSGFSSDSDVVKNLYEALKPKIDACAEPFCGYTIGATLFALRKSNWCEHIPDLVNNLTDKITASDASLSPLQASTALHGFMNSNLESPAAVKLLQALIAKIRVGLDPMSWNPWNIGMAFSGLRNMNTSSREVKELLSIFQPVIENVPGEFTAKDMTLTLRGFRSMPCDEFSSPTIGAIAAKFCNNFHQVMTGAQIAEALQVLQHKSGDDVVVRKLLRGFTDQLEKGMPYDNGDEIVGLARNLLDITKADNEDVQTFMHAIEDLY